MQAALSPPANASTWSSSTSHSPGRSGLELVRSLHAERPSLPIILFSERDAPETRTEAIAAGATDYVAAPFRPAELQRRVLASLGATQA